MPDEFNRVLSRKRIYSPDDESIFLDIPVIDRISFRDQKSSAQDKIFLINNTSDSSRKTHVRRVENPASHDYVEVERIDQIAFRDQKDSAQDTVFRLLNDDPQHLKTHVVRYYKDNDTSTDTWADSELVDEFVVTDQKDNAQTTHFVLNNDPVGPTIDDPDDPFSPTLGNVDLTLQLKDAGGGLDPPYRLDPFQNIVNFNAGYWVIFNMSWVDSFRGSRLPFAWVTSFDTPFQEDAPTSTDDGVQPELIVNDASFSLDRPVIASLNSDNPNWFQVNSFMRTNWPDLDPFVARDPTDGFPHAVDWWDNADVDSSGVAFNVRLYNRFVLLNSSKNIKLTLLNVPAAQAIVTNETTVDTNWSDSVFGGGTDSTIDFCTLGFDLAVGWQIYIFKKSANINPLDPSTIQTAIASGTGLLYKISSGTESYNDESGDNRIINMPSGTYNFHFASVTFPGGSVGPAIWPTFTVADADGSPDKYTWTTDNVTSRQTNYGIPPG